MRGLSDPVVNHAFFDVRNNIDLSVNHSAKLAKTCLRESDDATSTEMYSMKSGRRVCSLFRPLLCGPYAPFSRMS